MIAKQFQRGGYFMQETTDLVYFRKVSENNYSLDHLRPRHGSVLHITAQEYTFVKNFGLVAE